jgi:hypothetical protein
VTPGELAESLEGTQVKRAYKRKRSGERRSVSSPTAALYLKHGENHVTGQPATEWVGEGQPAKMVGKKKETR